MTKIALTYGALLAFANAVLALVLYLLGYHNDTERLEDAQRIAMIVGIVMALAGLFLAMKATRDKTADGTLSYGRAVGVGTLTSVFSGVFGALFGLLYGLVINPEFHEIIYQATINKMPAEQADAAAGMMRFFTGPVWTAVVSLIFSPIFGAVLSLIVGLFAKRTPPPVPAAP
jgi:hypothetical protein